MQWYLSAAGPGVYVRVEYRCASKGIMQPPAYNTSLFDNLCTGLMLAFLSDATTTFIDSIRKFTLPMSIRTLALAQYEIVVFDPFLNFKVLRRLVEPFHCLQAKKIVLLQSSF